MTRRSRVLWGTLFAAPVLASATLALAVVVAARSRPLPASLTIPRAATLVDVRDRHDSRIALVRHGDLLRRPVALGSIDSTLLVATLAAEDRRFHRHPGIDLLAIARAAGQNARDGWVVSGGSTLTQQLVKMLDREGGRASPGALARKLTEGWDALILDAQLDKRAILAAYLERAPYGAGIEGADAAALIYFGHGADRLSWEEAALLAALPQGPTRLDPRTDPVAAKRARDRVLARLPLSRSQREELIERALVLDVQTPVALPSTPAPHWIQAAIRAWPGATELRLPLDREIQRTATSALRAGLAELDARGADAGAVVVLDSRSGEVRAWVGSPDFRQPAHGQFDGASARRQPGSALKPFAYALAFEQGARPSSLLPDLPLSYGGRDGVFSPGNYTSEWRGPVRARLALANSWNAPAVALLERLGSESLLERLHRLGLRDLDAPPSRYGLGLVLGVGEVTLRDLTGAYGALARGGRAADRVELLEALEPSGGRLARRAALAETAFLPTGPVFTREACFLVNSILADPRARAIAFGREGLFEFESPFAIKTGTSSDWRDNWAFGYDDRWTVGVWIGRANGDPMDRVSGSAGAILTLRRILLALDANGTDPELRASRAFPEPPASMEERQVCALSGEPSSDACPSIVSDWFARRDPSGAACRWHTRVTLDRRTGQLARACTRSEDRVTEVWTSVPGTSLESAAETTPGATTGASLARARDLPSWIDLWSPDLWARWSREQRWNEPPETFTSCVCGEPGCGGVDPPPALATLRSVPGGRSAGGAKAGNSAPLPREVLARRRGVEILHPVDGSVYALDPSLPRSQQAVALEATGPARTIRWSIDGEPFTESPAGERVFWPLRAGRHRIRAELIPGEGAAEARSLEAHPLELQSAKGVSARFHEIRIEVEP